MAKLLAFAFLLACIYAGWQQLGSPAQPSTRTFVAGNYSSGASGPVVTVYGRESCGYTQKMLNALKSQKVPFNFLIVDEEPHKTYVDKGMKSLNLPPGSYNLPMVDVKGELFVSAPPETILAAYRAAN